MCVAAYELATGSGAVCLIRLAAAGTFKRIMLPRAPTVTIGRLLCLVSVPSFLARERHMTLPSRSVAVAVAFVLAATVAAEVPKPPDPNRGGVRQSVFQMRSGNIRVKDDPKN